jgi:predicted molibdopterin-dependent oxidoreductase YjgC
LNAKVYISPQLAKNKKLKSGEIVSLKMHEKTIKLPMEITDNVPEKCIWVQQGKAETRLGLPYCSVDIEKG